MDHVHSIGRLTGRGTVEITIEKVDGSMFSPSAGSEPKSTATIQVRFIWCSDSINEINLQSIHLQL